MERALLNEKDVTTDWMDSIFDSFDVTQDKNTIVGFIHHCPVIAHWSSNVVTWEVLPIGWEDHPYATLLLEQRLKEWEDEEQNVFSEIESLGQGKFGFIQRFYFKDED